jgi:uncharacterized membrane protein YidH (DUF202 family)
MLTGGTAVGAADAGGPEKGRDGQTGRGSRVGLAEDRTAMATFRTALALDRTTLAWIRTTLTMATFGFGTIGFFRALKARLPRRRPSGSTRARSTFGLAFVVLGLVATALSGIAHWFALRRLRRNEAPVSSRWPLSITVALLLAIIGSASLWYVLTP